MKKQKLSRSRRDFLRHASLATAGLAGSISCRGAMKALGQNGERKLGIALLGLGRYAGGQLAPALLETKKCYLAGIVTGHPEKAEQWTAKYNLKEKNVYNYENLERIADNKEIDIVYVVTPPGLHPEFVERVAKTGKHVISEKPMATSVEGCDRMIAACKNAKVRLGLGYRLHYDPFHREMVRLSSERELGPFTKLTGNFSFTMGRHEWRIEKVLGGGGAMMDVGIYVIHASCMATGLTPTTVTAREEPKKRPEFFSETEETITWTMDFPNGAKLEASTSFNANSNRFRAEGKNGWIDFNSAFSYRGLACDTSRGPMKFATINQQAAQMDDFAHCVLNRRDTQVAGELGRRDLQIISAIYESTRTGKPVKVRT